MKRRAAFCSVWLGAIATVALISLSLSSRAGAQSRSCGAIPAPHKPEDLPNAEREIVFQAEGNKTFRLDFGHSRVGDARRVAVDAFPEKLTSLRGLDVRLGGSFYLDGPGDRTISLNDDDGLYANLRRIDAGKLEVCVEARPKKITQFHPGRYTGMLVVAGGKKHVTLVAIPIELTFRAPLSKAIVIAIVGVILGLTVNVLGEAAAGQRTEGTSARDALKSYLSQLTFPATVIVAGIAGWIVFSQTYSSDPVWGANGGDATKLLGACFIAQLGSVEGVNLAKRIGKGDSNGRRDE